MQLKQFINRTAALVGGKLPDDVFLDLAGNIEHIFLELGLDLYTMILLPEHLLKFF